MRIRLINEHPVSVDMNIGIARNTHHKTLAVRAVIAHKNKRVGSRFVFIKPHNKHVYNNISVIDLDPVDLFTGVDVLKRRRHQKSHTDAEIRRRN